VRGALSATVYGAMKTQKVGGGFGNNNAALRNALNFFFQREKENFHYK